MSEKIIHFDGGVCISTNFDSDQCDAGGLHDWNGAVLTYRTRRGERRYINQDKYLIPGTSMPRREHMRMRIVAGECRCVKCHCPYTIAHNPNVL